MMAVEPNNTDLPDPSPGPTDDGYIAVAEKSVPQDPFCCSGPNKDDLGEVLGKPLATSTIDSLAAWHCAEGASVETIALSDQPFSDII